MRSKNNDTKFVFENVLILVCVEVSVWDNFSYDDFYSDNFVLILVCVEVSVWATFKGGKAGIFMVLILVCVEVSVWENRKNQ